MHELAEQLLKMIRKQELFRAGDRVGVAVSGGADSVSLLLLLLELRGELGIVLSVAHANHKLRGEESDGDARFVAELARRHSLTFHVRDAPLEATRNSGIEAAARRLRYGFFRQLVRENRVSKVATAHTLDDQAETVLLRILRGTGIRGLSGIHPRLILSGTNKERGDARGEVIRPLLDFRRAELQTFLRQQGQAWREDSSNCDLGFLRNRVRHVLLPVLQENFGLAVVENLADLAEIARAEEEHWTSDHPEVRMRGRGSGVGDSARASLETALLLALPLAAQRRALREWLEATAPDLTVSFRLIEEALELARGRAGQRLNLPGGYVLRRTKVDIRIECAGDRLKSAGYEYFLSVPGRVEIRELGMEIEAALVERKDVPEAERASLLDPGRMPKTLKVRNWEPGDRFWPAHTKEAKKVKDLLSDRHISGTEKKLWPVAEAEGLGLVWMRGFAVPAGCEPLPGASRALWIRVRNCVRAR